MLAERRPHDGVLGEEEGLLPARSGVTWVVDPIDGTVNYLYGIPAYAVSVAAVVGDRRPGAVDASVAAACTRSPTGARGPLASARGAYLDGRRLQVNPAVPACELPGRHRLRVHRRPAARQARVVAELLPQVRDIRRIGSAALDLCTLASGGLDVYYERGLQPWDLAAASLVAREAGASVVGLRGAAPGQEMTVAGPEPTLTELVAFLERMGADRDGTPDAGADSRLIDAVWWVNLVPRRAHPSPIGQNLGADPAGTTSVPRALSTYRRRAPARVR